MTYPGPLSLKNAGGPMHQMLGLGDQLMTQVDNQLMKQVKDRQAKRGLSNIGRPLNPNTFGIGTAIASLLGRDSGM